MNVPVASRFNSGFGAWLDLCQETHLVKTCFMVWSTSSAGSVRRNPAHSNPFCSSRASAQCRCKPKPVTWASGPRFNCLAQFRQPPPGRARPGRKLPGVFQSPGVARRLFIIGHGQYEFNALKTRQRGQH